MDIEDKVACLKYKLDDPDTSMNERLEILGLFIGFYTKKDFNVMIFFKELDRLVKVIGAI